MDFDSGQPNSARVWNYWLGGKDNFAADRAVADQVAAMFPQIAQVARVQRGFAQRAVRFLAGEAGIRQFLDIGAGLPAAESTHEIALPLAPESRVVYTDNDPVVMTHARALLKDEKGRCAFLDADLRDPATLLGTTGRLLDLEQPVALLLLGILGHVGDDAEATRIVRELTGALSSGSYLAIADGVSTSPEGTQAQERYNQRSPLPYHLRTPEQVTAFFSGLELVEPGLVPANRWRPGPARPDAELPGSATAGDPPVVGAIARKP